MVPTQRRSAAHVSSLPRQVVSQESRVRALVEIVLQATNKHLEDRPELQARIAGYRGGYAAVERRKLERRLFTGDLLCVIATNALELGIDIGDLDLTLHVGVPPTERPKAGVVHDCEYKYPHDDNVVAAHMTMVMVTMMLRRKTVMTVITVVIMIIIFIIIAVMLVKIKTVMAAQARDWLGGDLLGLRGRRGRPSTAILIAMVQGSAELLDAPLEQHFCRHPDDFFALCRPELLIKNGQANAIIWCTYSVGG
ncbi:HRQ1 [Symbiodinium sp. KB8]|nr:HRQ1 [Symbiodinium sp. KB8]